MGRKTGADAPTRDGTGSAARLDPFALPCRFAAPDAAADGGERRVTLERSRVVVDRIVGSVAMRIAVPMSHYSGVVARVAPAEIAEADRVEIVLAHPDRALDVPLSVTPHDGDGIAEWRSWSRALQLPLLVEGLDGIRKSPTARIGALEVGRPRPRRGKGFLKGRRTRFQAKRRTGKLVAGMTVHRGEREIIARD